MLSPEELREVLKALQEVLKALMFALGVIAGALVGGEW